MTDLSFLEVQYIFIFILLIMLTLVLFKPLHPWVLKSIHTFKNNFLYKWMSRFFLITATVFLLGPYPNTAAVIIMVLGMPNLIRWMIGSDAVKWNCKE